MKSLIKELLLVAIVFSAALPSVARETAQKPNIIFILADDLGYESINSYWADKNLLRTPHIDRLAEEGMRFTDASTPASICSPSRYGFLTGTYPWRSSMKFGVVNPNDQLIGDYLRF